MACDAPVTLRRAFSQDNPRGILVVPCGKCGGCLIARARSMALRAYHELPFHAQASFVTLTYDPAHLPTNDGDWPSLQPFDVVLFLKRLRKNLGKKWPKIKTIYAGEYGELRARPHYHLIIFGVDFRDPHPYRRFESPTSRRTVNVLNSVTPHDNPGYYSSSFLNWLWGKGDCLIGPVTPETVAYVCRYTIKKQQNKSHLTDTQYPEFIRVSNGIGERFIQKQFNQDRLLHHDTFVVNSQPYHPPRYYSEYLKKHNPEAHATLLSNRLQKSQHKDLLTLSQITSLRILNRQRASRSEQSRKL